MKIALTAKLLQGGKLKNEEHGRSDAFSNRHANYTFDLALGGKDQIETFALSRFRQIEAKGCKELVRWILSWVPDVKVLAPKSLWDRIAEKLQYGLRAQE